jgi:cytochrome c2
MSKFLKIIIPALGGTAGALGLAYTLADQFIAPIPSVMPVVISQASAQSAAPAAPKTTAPAAHSAATLASTGQFGLGRPALPEEIAAWDIDVSPDGTGLPAGSGDVLTGEELFADKCAACHGDFAEGVDNWPKLAGGADTLADEDPLKTVGSYWPYLSTTWDYINRSMPFGAAQTLEPDEVYAMVAYILYSNDLVDEDFVLSDATFSDFVLPNADGFILDDRATTEYPIWSVEPCMNDCKDSVEITMRAAVLDVTPEEEGTEPQPAAPVVAAAETTAPAPAPTQTAAEETPAAAAMALDPELIAAGEKVFKKCKSCHQIGAGAKNRSGPLLTGIVGAPAGAVDGFKYSNALKDAAGNGLVWDDENLAAFLTKPKSFLKGTKMSFSGLKTEADIAAITAYLASVPE